jgi:hypothetical protein
LLNRPSNTQQKHHAQNIILFLTSCFYATQPGLAAASATLRQLFFANSAPRPQRNLFRMLVIAKLNSATSDIVQKNTWTAEPVRVCAVPHNIFALGI